MLPDAVALLAGAAVLWLQPPEGGIKFYSLKDPNPEPSLAWFILNAFFLIAVVLLVTIGIGIAFGSFRLWLLERFPNNPFNGAPKDDLAQTFRLSDERTTPRSTTEAPSTPDR